VSHINPRLTLPQAFFYQKLGMKQSVLSNKAKHKHFREIITEGVLRMHEVSLMSEIINIVLEDARLHGFRKVDKIDVIVGDLSNVLPDALVLAFLHFQKQGLGILDGNTKLEIIREVAKAKCQTCLFEFSPDYRLALCPKCDLSNCLLISGETNLLLFDNINVY